MTLTTLPEAEAANAVIRYLTGQPDHLGHAPTHDQAKAALGELAEGAHKKLGAGLNRDRALELLDKHWPDPAETEARETYPAPDLEHLANRVKASRSHDFAFMEVGVDTIAYLLTLAATPAGQR